MRSRCPSEGRRPGPQFKIEYVGRHGADALEAQPAYIEFASKLALKGLETLELRGRRLAVGTSPETTNSVAFDFLVPPDQVGELAYRTSCTAQLMGEDGETVVAESSCPSPPRTGE